MQRGLAAVWTDVAASLARLVRAMNLDRACGDDILQDVYVLAHQRCPDGLDREEMRHWLFRVTVNRCNLEHRWIAQRARVHECLVRQTPRTTHTGGPAHEVERLESIQLVRQQLLSMDPQLHTVLVLRYFVQLDSKEIGAILDLSDSTVRGQLRRARLQLARQLISAGYEHDDR